MNSEPNEILHLHSNPNNGSLDRLSDLEIQILDFEAKPWLYGAKAEGITSHFQISTTRYYELLNGALAKEAALQYAPLLVKRLRRLREARISAR